MRRLEDKIALVTGGAAGIGRAIAETFAREGARVVIADRDGDAAGAVAQAITKSNGAAVAHRVDVTDTEEVKALMASLGEAFGRLDVLVNNAGVGERADFRHLDDAAWSRVWQVNLDGTVRCAREAFALLKGFRGKPAGDLNALANAIVALSRLAFRRGAVRSSPAWRRAPRRPRRACGAPSGARRGRSPWATSS
jgi:NAD(P)-dependent dehydrogenase (short-subunit alcohol dehydrogenase family)